MQSRHRLLLTTLLALPGALAAAQSAELPEGLSASDWSGIRAAHDASRHAVVAHEDGHRARNPRQRWTARFDGRGLTVTPDAGDWTWGLELQGYGWSAVEALATAPPATTVDGARLAYDWDERLTEWYVNDARGLEHGYTVLDRPERAVGSLTLALTVRGGLSPRISADGRDVRFVDEQGAPVLDYTGLRVDDAEGRTLDATWRAGAGGLVLEVRDGDAVYPLTVDPVVQQAYLKASNTDADDSFGQAVAVSGDTVIVGARGEDSGATGVDGDQSDDSTSSAGAAYVFVRNGTNWSQQAYLKASNTDAGDSFGRSVAVSGDTVVVGAWFEASGATGVDGDQSDDGTPDSGAVYVFVRSGATWSQEAYLKASNTDAGDTFGRSVAVSGDTVVVGANLEDSGATGVDGDQSDDSASNAGAAYVFVRSGTAWSQEAYLKASNAEAVDYFGMSVAVTGDTVVVGAVGEGSGATGVDGDQGDNGAPSAGAAYVFVRSGTTWSQQAYLKASNTGAGDAFGGLTGLAASGDTIVVGAPWERSGATGVDGDQSDDSASQAGAAYVFVRNGTTWSQQAYLKASNTDAIDNFGCAVAISGDKIAVGAFGEDSGATGVDGDQGDDATPNAGAAYVFVRNGTTWSQEAYLKASNTDASDLFGWSVAVSGDTVVAGAWAEDSGATGVDGDQSDDSATAAGAAYAFDLAAPWASYCTSTPNSTGAPALISASGSASIAANDFTLFAGPVPNQPYLFFHGPTPTEVPFGDGYRCVGSPQIRLLPPATAAGNLATRPVDLVALGFAPGTRYFQCWYRDPAAGGASFNLSDGLEVELVP